MEFLSIPAFERMMRMLPLGAMLETSALTGVTAREHDVPRRDIPRLTEDQLGESLNRFRKLHRGASCVVRPIAWSDERSFKGNWLKWVNCSLERGPMFAGYRLLGEANPTLPFGLFASFYKKKLVELSYTLAATSIDDLLPVLSKQYGQANRVIYNKSDDVDFASWVGGKALLDVELVPITPAISDRSFLRVGEEMSSSAVRIRTRLDSVPEADP